MPARTAALAACLLTSESVASHGCAVSDMASCCWMFYLKASECFTPWEHPGTSQPSCRLKGALTLPATLSER